MTSRITEAGVAPMKNRIITATGDLTTTYRIAAATTAVITKSLTAVTITAIMNTATALASLITGAAMRADTVSLTTVAHTGAAPSITASLSASAMRSGRGSEMRRGMYAGRGPRGYRRSDERIREDVNERLTDDWRVDASDIEVSVDNGLVTLAGSVGSRAEKRRAEDVAESVSGVMDVSNQLRVGSSVPFTTEAPEMARVKTAS